MFERPRLALKRNPLKSIKTAIETGKMVWGSEEVSSSVTYHLNGLKKDVCVCVCVKMMYDIVHENKNFIKFQRRLQIYHFFPFFINLRKDNFRECISFFERNL